MSAGQGSGQSSEEDRREFKILAALRRTCYKPVIALVGFGLPQTDHTGMLQHSGVFVFAGVIYSFFDLPLFFARRAILYCRWLTNGMRQSTNGSSIANQRRKAFGAIFRRTLGLCHVYRYLEPLLNGHHDPLGCAFAGGHL